MGLYQEDEPVPFGSFRYRTDKEQRPERLREYIEECLSGRRHGAGGQSPVEGFVFSSVVPEVNILYHETARLLGAREPLQIGPDCRLGIKIGYDRPAQLGVDRIVNAAAAHHEYRRDTVIIDLGTAVTFCVLHGDGNYDGGLICPGAGVSSEALARGTAQLGRVELEKPMDLVARDTLGALRSGLYYGWVSMAEGIVGRVEKHYGKPFFVLLTGGYAEILADEMNLDLLVDPLLTMKGIQYIYSLNRPGAR